jgi:transposase
VTAQHAKHFILALCEEFQKDLIVVLDGAPYFRASAVTDLAARDDLEFVRLPAYSPELNPVEECWRQVKRDLSNRSSARSRNSRQRSTTHSISCRFQI